MHPTFAQYTTGLEESLQRLLAMPPIKPVRLPSSLPAAGVYLFTENDMHLYVGRSNNLRRRMQRHGTQGATHQQAAFAFRLARTETGNLRASYKKEGSRAHLMTNPDFSASFVAAKQRIQRMDLRYVEEADPLRQTLLEVYVAVVLKTPFNDFDNH